MHVRETARGAKKPKTVARILSISYDEQLLGTREALLQHAGHEVVSAEGFSRAFHFCELHNAGFDLIVLGHSIPTAHAQWLPCFDSENRQSNR